MAVDQDMQQFIHLTQRIRQLLKQVVELQKNEQRLRDELARIKLGAAEQEFKKRMAVLEEEIKRLKKENRTLKEKEQLIKNKLERLAVKLNDIEW